MSNLACYLIGGIGIAAAGWGLVAWPRWWVAQCRKASVRRRLRQFAAWRTGGRHG